MYIYTMYMQLVQYSAFSYMHVHVYCTCILRKALSATCVRIELTYLEQILPCYHGILITGTGRECRDSQRGP